MNRLRGLYKRLIVEEEKKPLLENDFMSSTIGRGNKRMGLSVEEVQAVLATDRAYRRVGLEEGVDLHYLPIEVDRHHEIPEDFGMPILDPVNVFRNNNGGPSNVSNQKVEKARKWDLAGSDEEFKKRLFSNYPFLDPENGFDWSNKMLAGGLVQVLMCGQNPNNRRYWSSNRGNGIAELDLDFFIYGVKGVEDANRILKEMKDYFQSKIDESLEELAVLDLDEHKSVKNSIKKWSKSSDQYQQYSLRKASKYVIYYSRTLHTFSFHLPLANEKFYKKSQSNEYLGCKLIDIQVILRMYHSKSEVLHGFDLGSSAVGFDGKRVMMSRLGKFALETKCLILDPSRRSTSYENRISKYVTSRGFRLIIPNLNVDQLKARSLPFRTFRIDDPNNCMGFPTGLESKLAISLYGMGNFLDNMDPKQSAKIIFMPYMAITRWVDGDGDGNVIKILGVVPNFKRLGKETDYGDKEDRDNHDRIRYHGVNPTYHDYKKILKGQIDQIPKLSKTFEKAMEGSGMIEPIRKMYKEKLEINRNNMKKYLEQTMIDPENKVVLETRLQQFEDEGKARFESFIEEYRHPVEWMVENPGTQLCGSFNPIFEEPSKWYGWRFYQPDEDELCRLMVEAKMGKEESMKKVVEIYRDR